MHDSAYETPCHACGNGKEVAVRNGASPKGAGVGLSGDTKKKKKKKMNNSSNKKKKTTIKLKSEAKAAKPRRLKFKLIRKTKARRASEKCVPSKAMCAHLRQRAMPLAKFPAHELLLFEEWF